jgi:hypothetical protein
MQDCKIILQLDTQKGRKVFQYDHDSNAVKGPALIFDSN